MPKTNKTIEERFWEKVNITDLFSCWNWTLHIKKDGYGQFWFNGKNELTHRVAWILTYGEIPEGMYVCHTCDNPSCVYPAHLFLGTQRDNMNDMIKKHRQPNNTGINNPNVKLTENQILEIMSLLKTNISQVNIAKQYSVNKSRISAINTKRTWKHIPRI